MVLSTQPKRRPTVHHKKRTGHHQKQSKQYMKTYWPYLPLLGVGAAANVLLDRLVGSSTLATTASITPTMSRLEWWTGFGMLATLVIACLAFLCATWVVTHHARAWQRAIVKSEDFIVHHRKTNLILTGAAVGGFLLTRNVIL